MKRTIALVLTAMMLLSVLLSGCGDNSTSSAVSSGSSVATGDAANADPDNPYANLDLSKTENIVTYVVGSEPNAIAEVMAQVNEKTKAAINTTMEMYFIPTSELTTKYPLVMAGGVAANSHLRTALDTLCRRRGIRFVVPERGLCGDNGAMIAAAGYFRYEKGWFAGTDLNASACDSDD